MGTIALFLAMGKLIVGGEPTDAVRGPYCFTATTPSTATHAVMSQGATHVVAVGGAQHAVKAGCGCE